MFDTLLTSLTKDTDFPPRTWILESLTKVLNGQQYDHLLYEFHDERGAGGEYIPLRLRKPCVRYPLCRLVVEDSVALLFSEGHFPAIDTPDHATRDAIEHLVRAARLNQVMTEAAIRGSIGSVAILMRILKGRPHFQVLDTTFLTPVWDPTEPDVLMAVTERYKVSADQLRTSGYLVPDNTVDYWFQRSWDTQSEVWYVPTRSDTNASMSIDYDRSTTHSLGFVPIVWIKNLPGPSSTGDPNDGAATFRAAIETQIEIDYQLSQAGRGLKYSSDPTLLLKDPAGTGTDLIKSAGNALVVGEHGDARLLEIGGTASAAVVEYVRTLRDLALESIHGNRTSPDRLTAAQSGKAMELMNQGLLWLADNLRVSYGAGLIDLIAMVRKASRIYPLHTSGAQLNAMVPDAPVSLRWPDWYPPTAAERQLDASTIKTLVDAGLISRSSAVKALSGTYGLNNISDELAMIEAQERENSPDE